MGKFWKRVYVFFVCSAMMCGCSQNHTQPVYEVVTSVDVLTQRDGQLLHRHYDSQEKMRPVLLYLRTLKHLPIFEPPAEMEGDDIFLITVGLSSGRQRYYRQAKHRYFSFDEGPWRAIDPGSAAGLYRILQALPSDEFSS